MKYLLSTLLVAATLTLSAQQEFNAGEKISDKEFRNQALTPPMG